MPLEALGRQPGAAGALGAPVQKGPGAPQARTQEEVARTSSCTGQTPESLGEVARMLACPGRPVDRPLAPAAKVQVLARSQQASVYLQGERGLSWCRH